MTTTLPRHTRAHLADRVYARLEAELHDFLWASGDRLSESEIGQRLGVSRTPVRESLFRLRNEGFLEVESKTGWFVRPIDFGLLDQLYDLRTVFELAAVTKLAARRDDPPALGELESAWLVPPAERLADPTAVGALDERFHATLVAATGNGEMARVHQEVTDRIRIVRRLDFTRPDRIEATYDEHAKILREVLRRHGDAAQMLLRGHIERSKVEVRKITLHQLHEVRLRSQAAGAR
jgi:DNA-binding GntR family transcriptional regulator